MFALPLAAQTWTSYDGRKLEADFVSKTRSFGVGLWTALVWALLLLGMVAEQKARLPRERCVFLWNAFTTHDGTARIRWRRLGAAFVVVAAMMCVAMCFNAAAMRLLIGDTAPPILMMLMGVPMTIGPLFAALGSIAKIPQKPLTAAERQKVWKRFGLIALVFALLVLCAYLFSCRLQPRTCRPRESGWPQVGELHSHFRAGE